MYSNPSVLFLYRINIWFIKMYRNIQIIAHICIFKSFFFYDIIQVKNSLPSVNRGLPFQELGYRFGISSLFVILLYNDVAKGV